MRTLYFFAALLLLGQFSCRPEESVPPQANVTVVFRNIANGEPVELGTGKQYTTANGNKFAVDILKYYVTNIELVRKDGSTSYLAGNYDLVDAATPGMEQILLDSVDNGVYSKIRFKLGVDEDHNHKGDQMGDLDPIHGMLWLWSTGYIFFKHEGPLVKTDGTTGYMIYHYGTDVALVDVELPIADMEVKGKDRNLYLSFDMGNLYSNPNILNLDVDYFRQSITANDMPWVQTLKVNFPGAFSFVKYE